jgi:integrase
MTKVKLKHVHVFRDRHGRQRAYLRIPGRKAVPLHGAPGSPEFMLAYQAALADEPLPSTEVGAARTIPGTINAAVISYYNSAGFAQLAPKTRRERRYILEQLRSAHGEKRVALLQRSHVDTMIAGKLTTPSAARSFLIVLRALMVNCILQGWRVDDPTQGVKLRPIRTDGFPTWSEEDISRFEAAHPIGSRARLALALALFTAQRQGDLIRLGPQHVRDGVIQLRQEKTNAPLLIPVHPEFALVLEGTPTEHLTFLTTKDGRPFSAAGFTNWFHDMCKEAGLPRGTSVHGLRKAAARRLAEGGASANVIASITGHASLREVQRYTAAADQARMARSGIETMVAAFPERERSFANLSNETRKPSSKSLK